MPVLYIFNYYMYILLHTNIILYTCIEQLFRAVQHPPINSIIKVHITVYHTYILWLGAG